MNKVQNKMYEKIKTPTDLYKFLSDEYELKDTAVVIGKYIRENGISSDDKVINECIHYIVSNMVEKLYYDDEVDVEYHVMLDNIKYRINQLDKNVLEELQERKTLKQAYKDINNILEIYKPDSKIEKETGMVNIILYFANREDGLNYIKEILKKIPSAVNLKVGDSHIIVTILKMYIDNFKIMLENKKNTYINKDYIFEVYSLFVRNINFRLSKKDKIEINYMLTSFQFYIQNTVIKEKKKISALKGIRSVAKLLENYKNIEYNNPAPLYEVNDDYVSLLVTDILNSYESRRKNSPESTVPVSAFILNDSNFAYTILEHDNEYIVKLYVPNIQKFIAQDSDLRLYLYNEFIMESNKQNLNESFKDAMFAIYEKKYNFKPGKCYDAITYEFVYNKNGSIMDFDIKNEFIYVKEKFYFNQDYYWMLHKPLNYEYDYEMLQKLYRRIALKTNHVIKDRSSNTQLNDFFKEELSREFSKYAHEHKLPFLYYGHNLEYKEESEEHLKNIIADLSKVSNDEFNEINNILNRNLDKKHYTTTYYENYKYDLNLLKTFDFLGLEYQRLISLILFNSRLLDDKRLASLKLHYEDYFKQLANDLNNNISYVDQDQLKQTKGKIKRRKVSKNYITKTF